MRERERKERVRGRAVGRGRFSYLRVELALELVNAGRELPEQCQGGRGDVREGAGVFFQLPRVRPCAACHTWSRQAAIDAPWTSVLAYLLASKSLAKKLA